MKVTGIIKRFDCARGYGFVLADEGPNVLVTSNVLRAAGFSAYPEMGSRITCEADSGPKGLFATAVLDLDEKQKIGNANLQPHHRVNPESGFERAVVKWYNSALGYGFLTRGTGTPDIFVHKNTLKLFNIPPLKTGGSILVRHGSGRDGLVAAELAIDAPAFSSEG